ncbi:hypothetical protein [Sphingomonas faeni]|uniref:hypothetical protein n=1 Tax=Sphingomonas faeni TaxID=185950 RepID=UPI00277EA864|nr:hypothetical protein [Sphingomonas faeni]MDQ0839861.1 hypothetical protein [Sphingomonas faeni]
MTQVNLLYRLSVYLGKMARTPVEIRAQAKAYRQLHAYLQGPILTPAIEDVAIALDRLAVSIEQKDEAIRLIDGGAMVRLLTT